MIKILTGFLLWFAIALLLPQVTFAHILKTDGVIGAVLHVNPEDDPIAGEESSFFFEFKDKTNKFDPADCECIVTILQSGKQIYSQNLFENNDAPSLENASFSFTFPQKNVYKISISGKPIKANSFQVFNLEYDIRVSREIEAKVSSGSNSNILTITIISGIALFFGILYLLKRFKKS